MRRIRWPEENKAPGDPGSGSRGFYVRQDMLFRAALAVALFGLCVSAYAAYGGLGLVVISVVGMLALTHPFWLMKQTPRGPKERGRWDRDTDGAKLARQHAPHPHMRKHAGDGLTLAPAEPSTPRPEHLRR